MFWGTRWYHLTHDTPARALARAFSFPPAGPPWPVGANVNGGETVNQTKSRWRRRRRAETDDEDDETRRLASNNAA
jgi:hypothetical protein